MNATIFQALSFDKYHNIQVGRIGEYWVKFMLALCGFDPYTSEVDDKGIDFIVRINNHIHLDIQVKTIRPDKTGYVFVTKKGSWADLSDNMYLALVLLQNQSVPETYLIPASAWKLPDALFADHKYDSSKKSKPEWGLNLSKKNRHLLEPYRFDKQAAGIRQLFGLEEPVAELVSM